jgi:hypothetical protein
VGTAARKEAAIWTYQAMIWLPARLLRATVTGQLSVLVSTTANRKSFQADVNCHMKTTTKLGIASGSMILVKVSKMPAPSIRAASMSVLGIVAKQLRKISVVIGMP